eukprot:1660375-Rhodomonas_salina.3
MQRQRAVRQHPHLFLRTLQPAALPACAAASRNADQDPVLGADRRVDCSEPALEPPPLPRHSTPLPSTRTPDLGAMGFRRRVLAGGVRGGVGDRACTDMARGRGLGIYPVSYTHLTLPTICSV